MSTFLERPAALMRRPWFAVLVGLLLLSLLIWFAGPYFAFADHKPLDSVTARLAVIVLLVLGWVVGVQLRQLLAARAGERLAQQVAAPGAAQSGAQSGIAPADLQQLQARFAEAVAALKKSRRSGANLYQLPWYVMIGPPGSGKTTAIAHSGLHFPLAQKYGREAVRGVGGTRNCDWWFTDEAVLLDTAGRYTTQDSDRQADAAGWSEFLKLLKRHRRRQPVNGVIVALSAADLMTQGEAGLRAHVAAVRARLDELNLHFGVTLPVYVLFSKCDLIAGFSEYFDDLDADARRQVWGVSFPLAASETGQAALDFAAEYDQLLARVQAGVLARIDAERDPRRRALIFGFPQQLAAFRALALAFVDGVFAATSFDGRTLLRGVYLTSGTQSGTPIDRLIGAVARRFGLDAAGPARAAGVGRAYFIERLFRAVIFAEAGLAGLDRRLELRRRVWQTAAYAGLALLVIAGTIALSVSYSRNATRVRQVAAAYAQYRAVADRETADAATRLDGVLPRLDALAASVAVARGGEDGAPWSMRWGLYQGRALGEAADDAYHRELNARLLPVFIVRARGWLDRFATQPLLLYDALRVYLMLGDPARLEPDTVSGVAVAELGREFADDRATHDALAAHVGQLFAVRARLQPSPLDSQAVAQARAALQVASVPALIVGRMQARYRGDGARALVPERAVPNLDLAFIRAGGKRWSEPLPALYTAAVFHEISRLGAPGIIARFAPEPWVLGDDGADLRQMPRHAYAAMQIYEQDYIRAWDEFLAEVRINPARDFKQVLYALGSPTSPLKALLAEVRKQTDLLATDAAGRAADVAAAKAGSAIAGTLGANPLAQGLVDAASSDAAAEPDGTLVSRHFAAINRLSDGAPGSQPIDRVIALFAQANQQLSATGSGFGQASTIDSLKAGQGSVLQQLALEARQLPAPVDRIVASAADRSAQLVMDQAQGEAGAKLKEQVVPQCEAIVASGYPFKPRATSDVPTADFGRLFGAGGLLDAFFTQTLAPMVDRTTRPWSMRPGAAPLPPGMLASFEAADHIRQQYFRNAQADPEVRFTLTPQSLDASVARFVFEFGGQRYEYRHEQPQPWALRWPADAGVAAITFEDTQGAAPFLKFEGPWALFRLLAAGKLEARGASDYLVTWQAGGHAVRLQLTAASINNPFRSDELVKFRCPG
jgi:type VI secretion system protein ImpL